MARNILHGVYGVNASEYSSPASSILFPFILALTQALGARSLGPLIVDAAAGLASVWIAAGFVWRHWLGRLSGRRDARLAYAVGLLLILCLSALALPMTGLEHMIHVLAVVVIIDGLVEAVDHGRVSARLCVAVALAPLIRFEGFALSGAAILALVWIGRWRPALGISLAIGAAAGAYLAFMKALGLPFLPSSVLLKSSVAAATVDRGGLAGPARALIGNLLHSLSVPEGMVLTGMLALIAAGVSVCPAPERRGDRIVGAVAAAAILAHILAGPYNAFHRYEVYANIIGVLALIYLFRSRLAQPARPRFGIPAPTAVCALALVCVPYAYAAVRTPWAAEGIYNQQFQMHRFAAEAYRKPIAVNDLGLVSYRSPSFVLDLWGLGSERVRRLRATDRFNAVEIGRIVDQYHVGLVMIYEPWFAGKIPQDWRKVAILRTSGVYSSCSGVTFFATAWQDPQSLADELKVFQKTLPAADRLDFGPSFGPVPCRRNTAFEPAAR